MWDELSSTLHIDDIIKYDMYPWTTRGLSKNPTLTMAYIDSHPDLSWNWYDITQNINLETQYDNRIEFDIHYIEYNPTCPLHLIPCDIYNALAQYISMDKIINHPEIECDIYDLCYNPSLTIDYIESHPSPNWLWSRIAWCINMPIEYPKHPHHRIWNEYNIIYNPTRTYDIMKKLGHDRWDNHYHSTMSLRELYKLHSYSYNIYTNPNLTLIDHISLHTIPDLRIYKPYIVSKWHYDISIHICS